MDIVIYLMAIFMLFLGWFGAYLHYRNEIKELESQHAFDVHDAYTNGESNALFNRDRVKEAYEYHFHPRP